METSPQYIANREPWSRAERLYMLKCLFVEGGEYSTLQLAERFGVTTDTIARDLRILSTKLCVPLVCNRIVEVRWRLAESS